MKKTYKFAKILFYLPKIVMGYFVCQYSSQLFIVCLLEKTRCDAKLAARIGGVNIRALHDTNANLFS